MKYLIVIDSTASGRPSRSYLCRPRGVFCFWTFQREEATEFASRDEAQRVIETTMRLKSGVLIVPVSEDPGAKGGKPDGKEWRIQSESVRGWVRRAA
jgi:hypothetical protein